MKFLKKLHCLSLEKRKRIFLVAIIILGIFFFAIWIKIISWRLKNIQPEDFLREIKTPTLSFPRIEMPAIPTGIPATSVIPNFN